MTLFWKVVSLARLWRGGGGSARLPCVSSQSVAFARWAQSHSSGALCHLPVGDAAMRIMSSPPCMRPSGQGAEAGALMLLWRPMGFGLCFGGNFGAYRRGLINWWWVQQACEKVVYWLKHCIEQWVSIALSDVWLQFSRGLAARSQSCQTFLGFINQVMSRVRASMSALASVPIKTDLWKKTHMCNGSSEPQCAVRCTSPSLDAPFYPSGEMLPLQTGLELVQEPLRLRPHA